MRYLIDGYNLAYAMGLLRKQTGPAGVEAARRDLLIWLLRYYGPAKPTVTVVFDASRAPPGASSQHQHQGIHVLYALHQQADDLIEDLVEADSSPRQLTVVSDDRRIKDAARKKQCIVRGCLDFMEEVQRQRHPLAVPARPAEPDKPDNVSAEETQRWLKEFGGAEGANEDGY
jgi:predicted RNA-binding protein with PIN domain